ncbi:Fpg/Nei family DNA glycosylase [soil metagenome]
MSSPQGRFAAGAALVDGTLLRRADAVGKHLFIDFGPDRQVHVHLGLFGRTHLGDGPAPAPVGAVRLRIEGVDTFFDLRGAAVCAVLSDGERGELVARVGPDPLRRDAEPERAWDRISRSSRPLAALLMDQGVLAGIGNVYRAEVLFRHALHPYLPGRSLPRPAWEALWDDLVALLADGVRTGRIATLRPEHGRRRRSGPRHYVYRRAGERCLVCAEPVAFAELAGRRLYWCPSCQPP